MKQFVHRMVRFAGLLLAVWALGLLASLVSPQVESTLVAKQSDWGHVNQKTLEWREGHVSPDVMFFGSSTCYCGIDPHALESHGLRGFSFCSNAQGPQHSTVLLEAALKDHVPAMVVLDLYPMLCTAPTMSAEPLRDWAVNGNLWTAPWRDAMLTMLRSAQDPFAAVQMLYFGLRNTWTPSGDRAKPDLHGAYSGLGFVPRSFPALEAVPETTPPSGRWSSTALAAVDAARRMCDQQGVSLVLLTPPQLVEQELEGRPSRSGMAWIDGNAWPGAKTPGFYYDDHHLVAEGAASYSTWLASELNRQFQRP